MVITSKYCNTLGILGLILLVNSCATTTSGSGSWFYVGETHWGDMKHYISPNSIKRNGSIAKVESKNVLKVPETTSFLKGKKYAYDINQWEVNCKQARVKLISASYYNTSNQLIFTHKIQNPKSNPILKNTMFASIYRFTCDKFSS
ncbi:MAG: hypothetical protein GKC53_03695 [Neisseriaceae bacterium]|nr:MAG: hypothetical protein GKC53_03695 [Neisseriaceae bacterium]